MKKINLNIIYLLLSNCLCLGQGIWTDLPHQINESIYSVSFSDNDHGYITCANNKIYKTSDGGFNWTDVSPNLGIVSAGCWYTSICSRDSMTAFAGTMCYDFFLRTINGGVSWDTVQIFWQPWSVHFINDTIGFMVAANGLHKTTNRGSNWNLLTNNSCSSGFWFINDSVGFVGGLGNSIYKTTNQGLTWTIHNTGLSQGAQSIFFFNSTKGIAVDGDGYWALTYDQGQTWSTFSHGSHLNQVGIYFVNDYLGFKIYSSSGGSFMESTNGGISWSSISSGNCNGITDMSFPSLCVGYIVGLGGNILKYTDTICLLAEDVSQTLDKLFFLSPYPNPSSGAFTFELATQQINNLSLTVTNQFGEVMLKQKITVPKTEINLSSQSGGIYFLQLRNNKETLTKKIIISR